jgi:hypothetical protein
MHITAHLTCDFAGIKSPAAPADTECMTNSKLQARHQVNVAIRAGVPRVHHAIDDVPIDVVQAAILVAENTPDPRADRVERAIVHMDAGPLDSYSVAQALISSILADSNR